MFEHFCGPKAWEDERDKQKGLLVSILDDITDGELAINVQSNHLRNLKFVFYQVSLSMMSPMCFSQWIRNRNGIFKVNNKDMDQYLKSTQSLQSKHQNYVCGIVLLSSLLTLNKFSVFVLRFYSLQITLNMGLLA